MYFPTLILAKSTQLSIIIKHRHRQKLIYYLTNCNPKLTRGLFHFPYRLALPGVISSRSTNSAKIFTSHVFSVLAVQCCPFLEKKIARSSIRCTWRFFWSNGKCGPSTFGVQTARVISSTVESCVFVFRTDTHLQVLFSSSSSRHLSGS